MISRFLYEESWYGKTTGSSQNQISGCYTFCIEMIHLDQRRQVVHKIDRKQRLQMSTVHKFVPWMLRLPSLFALLIQPRSDLTLLVQKNYHVFSSTYATVNLSLVASLNRYTAGAPWQFYLTINSHLHPLKLFARESPIFPYDYHCKRFNIRTWEVVSSSWFHIARGSSVLSWFSSWEAHYPRGSLGSCGVRVPSSD